MDAVQTAIKDKIIVVQGRQVILCNLHTRSFLPVEPIGQFLIFLFSYYDVVYCSAISELNCILA